MGHAWRNDHVMRPRDFTIAMYEQLLDALKGSGRSFSTFTAFLRKPVPHVVMLRHDVDDRKLHSLAFARIQHQRGIVGTYYFRMVPQSFDEAVIRDIHAMGHEIGYHYEEMDLCAGDPVKAIELFKRNLERLRAIVPVTSICMHGSPRSSYDNKDLWKYHDRRDLGIEGEPYLDLDFDRVGYYTDTGRCWDGGAYSVRDRVPSKGQSSYHHTADMIDAIGQDVFPTQAMLTFHPQRWTDSHPLWLRDRYVQYAKNYAKYGLIQWRALSARLMS